MAETVRVQNENLSLRREIAGLELELVDAKEAIDAFRSRLVNLEASRGNQGPDGRELLLSHLAAPISQLRMQQWLMDSGKEISARSILAVAGQIADLVERAGLEPFGSTGEDIPFDPQVPDPLAGGVWFSPG